MYGPEHSVHHRRIGNTIAVVGEGHRTDLGHAPDRRKPLAAPFVCCATDDKDTRPVGLLGLVLNKLNHLGRVDRRVGVGHAADAREPALDRGRSAAGHRLVMLGIGLPQMDVDVDQTRGHDAAVRVDSFGLARRRNPSDSRDHAVADQHVRSFVKAAAGVDHAPALDQDMRHSRRF